MSSQFLSLEDAAKKLGVTTDQLVAFRSEGKIRGFRDGASWKFPENELQRLADDLANASGAYDPYQMTGMDMDDEQAGGDHPSAGGSGVLVDELDLGSAIVSAGSSSRLGSDVNLVAGDGEGSDVQVVTSASEDDSDFLLKDRREGLVELDSGELQLSPSEPAITHDSELLDLAIDPKTGSTGPIRRGSEPEKPAARSDSGLSFDSNDDQDSDDELLGLSDDDDLLGDDATLASPIAGKGSNTGKGGKSADLSSLELMDDLDVSPSGSSGSGLGGHEHDVLGELDLLSAEGGGSGLITGDSGKVIGAGSDAGGAGGSSGRGSGLALDDDDELLITDDDDDLVLGGSDLSVAGDSGINLMSPSDSGISLESEPLDLAGSSISALDLGAEMGGGAGSSGKGIGSGSGHGGEEFQLSPSGISLDAESDSSSQVIEVEDSAAFAEADPALLGGDEFGEALDGDEAFAQEEGGFGDEDALAVEDGFGEEPVTAGRASGYMGGYEVPYSVFQVVGLVCIVTVMSLGGMLMSDLVRNIWTYSEPAAPVSGLTDWLIDISPFGS